MRVVSSTMQTVWAAHHVRQRYAKVRPQPEMQHQSLDTIKLTHYRNTRPSAANEEARRSFTND
jgi:hypothetical protein